MSPQTLYEVLQGHCRSADDDISAHTDDMRMLNACWPTIDALLRDRDRLRALIDKLHASANTDGWP